MISTRNLNNLLDVGGLQERCKALAVIARIYQYGDIYTFDYIKDWGEETEAAVFDNQSGDSVYIFFDKNGCLISGFDHESPMSPYREEPPKIWPGVYETVPKELRQFIEEEPVKSIGATFCIWSKNREKWEMGKIDYPQNGDDGSKNLLKYFSQDIEPLIDFLKDYYTNDEDSVGFMRKILEHKAISKDEIERFKVEEQTVEAIWEIASSLQSLRRNLD